mgnify:CR=1 FL=1
MACLSLTIVVLTGSVLCLVNSTILRNKRQTGNDLGPDCSLCDYGSSSVYYPDNLDCSKYWRCERIVLGQSGNYNYRRYHLQCGSNTYWNQNILTCGWTPNTPECTIVPVTTATPTTEQPIENCEPSWQSDWVTMQSQAGADSFMELNHGLDELPLKGKVLVRPLSGPNAGLVFEGIGSQQSDDDFDNPYCGVVFMYNSTHARVGAPTVNNGFAAGRIFCAGQSGWSDGDGNAQSEQEAEVKILLWLPETFPPPDVAIDWTHIAASDPNALFYEFLNPTGQDLAWIQIQVMVEDRQGLSWINEGIGSDNSVNGNDRRWYQNGGIVYSHNETSIRIWARSYAAYLSTTVGTIGIAEDGWGYDKANAVLSAITGEVRIFGWTTPGEPVFTSEIDVDLDGDESQQQAEIVLNPAVGDPITSLVSLQVIPVDGENEGFTFYGSGIMPRAAYSNHMYAGVQFGYSESLIRLFYPVGAGGCLVRIGADYGGIHQQCARRARIRVTIWDVSPIECENGGIAQQNGDTCECVCVNGFTGPHCEVAPCEFAAVPGEPAKYLWSIVNIIMDCAPGTHYDQDACGCVMGGPIPNPSCTNDLLLFFPFDEDLNDHGCNKAYGENYGVTLLSGGVHGWPSKMAYFNGSSLILVHFMENYFANNQVDQFTIMLWFLRSGDPSNIGGLVNNGNCDAVPSFDMHVGPGQVASGAVNGQSMDDVDVYEWGWNWEHVAMVYDGNTLQFYLNGNLQAAPPVPLTGYISNRQCPMVIGQTGTDQSRGFFTGYMDELYVYTRALSAAEVMANCQLSHQCNI